MNGGGGAQTNGPWIEGNTWNYFQKPSVEGKVSWPNAEFSNRISGNNRIISGNDLPLNYTTGSFPISPSDPAYQYDRNPNSIKPQSIQETVPVSPVYSDTPSCMGGEVGIMLSGVALFNGFDAEMRDAAAHEVQDSCDAHPDESGEYHYHSLSSCFKDISEKTVLGYALDGFPITGPEVAPGKFLTTTDLDECHGIVSDITIDGKTVTTYHYVMTQDFPYSVSCFRGKPVSLTVTSGGLKQNQNNQQQTLNQQGQPPQAALNACSGSRAGDSCSFEGQRGQITGYCQNTPSGSIACVPAK